LKSVRTSVQINPARGPRPFAALIVSAAVVNVRRRSSPRFA
jgi:hypothetical protein